MRVLVACEFSGVVRDAFKKREHAVWSCDLLDTQREGLHFKGDVMQLFNNPDVPPWDLMIAFPPCTHLTSSGARWFTEKKQQQIDAINFVRKLLDAPVKHIAIENPIGVLSTFIRKPHQIIQPWQFGHGETKATCLWLKNLPKLKPTNIVEGREARIHRMPLGKDRAKERSRTFQGIADAMADQWGIL